MGFVRVDVDDTFRTSRLCCVVCRVVSCRTAVDEWSATSFSKTTTGMRQQLSADS